ncbi:Serine/threonine-protein kinase 19 [Porphyridium purpureum]|uniref:Serine/threonine-protein kinase 19 n=1 Tax=Porphyridium purpureum TaxID=35688 RepID=A0A5J4Z1Y7_PORPP|nr:Serine/threonine-protein kinase 19 [Porphyridium purpureum]|eukprot:POR2542..scf208_2
MSEDGVLWTNTLAAGMSRKRASTQARESVRKRRGLQSLRHIRGRTGSAARAAQASEDKEENTDEFDLDHAFLEEVLPALPTDTELAVWVLRAAVPRNELKELADVVPVVLRTQLYALVADHVLLDAHLVELKKKNIVVEMALFGRSEFDTMVVLREDLEQLSMQRVERAHTSKIVEHLQKDKMCTRLFFKYIGHAPMQPLSTTGAELLEAVEKSRTDHALWASTSLTNEEVVHRLVRIGLLIMRHVMDEYWFSVPGLSAMLQWIRAGRKQLFKMVRNSSFGQVLVSSLERRRVAGSKLDATFHIRDLVGLGQLEVIRTPGQGALLRCRDDVSARASLNDLW